jgi:hypothetical protein
MLYKKSSGKERILTATLLLMLLATALAEAMFVNRASANFTPPPNYIIIFNSPKNRTYVTKNVPLTFEIDGQVSQVFVFLDGAPLGIRKVTSDANPYSASVNLTNLSEGAHCVEVWWSSYHPFDRGDFGAMHFAVDTVSPLVSIVSPKNKTYDAGAVPLNLRLGERVSWIGYSLNGKTNVTISEVCVPTMLSYGRVNVSGFTLSTVLTGLPSGVHSLTVYAEDEAGNVGKSAPVAFKVENQTQAQIAKSTERTSKGFPNVQMTGAIIVSAAVVSFGLTAYFVRRNKKRRVA